MTLNILGREFTQREAVLVGLTALAGVLFGLSQLQRLTGAVGSQSPQEIYADLLTETRKLSTANAKLRKSTNQLLNPHFQLPTITLSAEVGSHIDQLARDSGLTFTSLTTGTARKGKKYQTITYRFKPTSDMNSLVAFADTLRTSKYLLCLESWSLKPADDPGKIEADLTVRAYFKPEAKG